MDPHLILEKKAQLILGGGVRIPKGFVIPVRVSRSTAGPGAGSSSVTFEFSGARVKKAVSETEGEFELRDDGGSYSFWRDGELFLDGVHIVPVGFHAPEQAFFTLDERCMFRCAYCASPHLGKEAYKALTPDRMVEKIRGSPVRDTIKAIAFTSGVVGSIQETVDMFIRFVTRAREEFPDLPIGIEPYVDSEEQILALKRAGADEIKINIESARKDIFEKVCPDLDYDQVEAMLRHAVRIFGRGNVVSNMIYGLGESDDDVRDTLERFADMGVMVNLRPLKVTSANRARITEAVGELEPMTTERMIHLAHIQKEIFDRHGLKPSEARTMCFRCGCCDIIPFSDI